MKEKPNLINAVSKHWLFVIVLLVIFGSTYYSYANKGIVYSILTSDIEVVIKFINSFGIFSSFIFVLLVVIEVVIAAIPPLVLYLAGGLIFGSFFGGTLTLIGNLIGAIIAFFIARKYGRNFVEKEINKKKREKFDKFSKKYGGFAIFILRLNPLTSSDVVSYLAGLTTMPLRSLILGTLFGLAPFVYVQTFIGADIIRENPFLTLIFIWISIAYFVIFLYGFWFAFLKKRPRK